MRFSIRTKAIAGISALLMVLAVSLMSLSLYNHNRGIRAELLKRGGVSAENLAYNAAYPVLIGDTVSLIDFTGGVLAEKEVLYVGLVDGDGRVLVQRCREGMDSVMARALQRDLRARPRSNSIGTSEHFEAVETRDEAGHDRIIHFHSPIRLEPDRDSELASEFGLYSNQLGPQTPEAHEEIVGFVCLGITTQHIDETIAGVRNKMIWTTAVAILLAMLVVSAVVRLGLRPIHELVAATRRVASGDYSSKVREERNDEIGDLAVSFNKMTADLKSSRDALVEKELLEALVVELRETQEQLVQAGKLAAVGQLAAGVAHEINNPLAGIMGYAQLLSEKMRRKKDQGITSDDVGRYLSYVENMEKQSQRCKQIVQNLLKFARASSHEEMELVDCNDSLRETVSLIEHQLETHRIAVTMALAPNLPRVMGHPGKMQQILTNIIINAMQAMPDGGKITITTEQLADAVNLTIADTGVGIKQEHLDKIFEPFFTTKEIGQGTGLGLSVTYGLVHDMGGEISARSKVGEGSAFTIAFPIAQSRVAAEQGESAVPVASRPAQ